MVFTQALPSRYRDLAEPWISPMGPSSLSLSLSSHQLLRSSRCGDRLSFPRIHRRHTTQAPKVHPSVPSPWVSADGIVYYIIVCMLADRPGKVHYCRYIPRYTCIPSSFSYTISLVSRPCSALVSSTKIQSAVLHPTAIASPSEGPRLPC